MKIKRRTEIMRQSHEVTIIRFRPGAAEIFCEACAAEVSHLKVGPAAAFLSISETAIFRLAESGQIHSTETAAGSLMLCGNSLRLMAQELIRSREDKKKKTTAPKTLLALFTAGFLMLSAATIGAQSIEEKISKKSEETIITTESWHLFFSKGGRSNGLQKTGTGTKLPLFV